MIIGIDLGTTNSLVAVWKDGKPVIVPNALGHSLTPSVVGFDERGDILVGMAARERLLTHPQQTTALFKRYMGTDREIRLERQPASSKWKIKPGSGPQKFRAEELSSFVLKSLKADAEAFLGTPVTEAVITVPAYFSDAQRKATKIAGQLAGLKVERLLNEPTAAALAYGLHQADLESKFLVFDLGGGTFDVSILELFDGVMEVRASSGDNFLGGEDFVTVLADRFMTEVGTPAGLPALRHTPALYQRLREPIEKAKRHLTGHDTADITIQWEGREHSWTITAHHFQELADPLLKRLRTPIERALRDAQIRATELDEVILAGGATRMPMVRKLVAKLFGRLPAANLNPDEVVVMGAAVQAGLKMRDAALNEVVLTDVCPYTLGIDIAEQTGVNQYETGIFLPIIERNSVVPVSRVRSVATLRDNQKEVEFNIYQGESHYVKDNIHLGNIAIPIPPRPAGGVSMDVRFTYDINGLLEAEVTVSETGQSHRLVIEENPGVLTPEQIEQKLDVLSSLKIHPREQTENRTLLARLERLYEQSLGDMRTEIGQQLSIFVSILERQNPGEIKEAHRTLIAYCDHIEMDSYL